MKTLRAIISGILIASFFPGWMVAADDSGTFRGKWWNYYDRALEAADRGEWEAALADLGEALDRRDGDQRMARTYGMHFIDYFPHREMGIVYFMTGRIDQAIAELERSLRSEESAKAIYYLNQARRSRISKETGGKTEPPMVTIQVPVPETVLRVPSVMVRGKASGRGLITRITINGSPYRFDLAQAEMAFEQEAALRDGQNTVTVRAEDLLGHSQEQSVRVYLDREGPILNIYEMSRSGTGDGRRIAIHGEVSDDRGIAKILVGGKAVPVENDRSQEFRLSVELKDTGNQLTIEAVDLAGNETRAEMDLEREVSALSRRPEPFLLAFNGTGILSLDREAPVVRLKDAADIPLAFVDRYYVEGEVFDNGRVEKVLVNGREIGMKKGKKLFFGRMVELREGKNRIIVEAYDSAGNRAAAEFTVTREIPAILQNNSRMSLTVLPFDARQRTGPLTDLAYEYLIASFVDQKRFSVIERTKLDQVLLEQKISKAKLTDPEHSIRVGRLMAAEAIVATTIREDAKSVEVVSRVISTETSEVMEVRDVYSEDKSAGVMKELMEGLAAKIAASFPVVEGMVIKAERREIFSDIGDTAKVKKNTAVIVFRKGREIRHPVTGKSLGWETTRIGDGRIEEIQKDFSKIRLIDKNAGEVSIRDLVLTK